MRPAISPDGKWLVYAVRHDAETGLRLRELATGDERWLRWPVQRDDQESRFTRDLFPGGSFTPDSRAFITTWDGRLWRVELAGGAATEIPFTAEVALAMGPAVHFDTPWTPATSSPSRCGTPPSPPTAPAWSSPRSTGCTSWTCPTAPRAA